MKIRLDRGVIRWWLLAVGVLVAWPSPVPASVGVGLIALGMVVHLWSKGCLQQNRQLTVCGPYRWSRNPFYVANILIDLGLCLIINRIWLTIPFLIAWAVVYRWQILSEERTLEGIYGEAWLNYKRKVPVFFPYKRPYREVPAEQGFSWSNPNLSQSREIPRLVRTASYPLLLLMAANIGPMMWWHERTANLAWLGSAAGMACGAGIVALQAFAWVLKRQLHDRVAVLPAVLHRHGVQLGLMVGYLAVLTVVKQGAIPPNRYVMGIGIALLVMGFVALRRRQRKPGLAADAGAWGSALLAAGLLAGLPWATILAVVSALSISIDVHIGAARSNGLLDFGAGTSEQPSGKQPLWDRLGLAANYALFSLVVLALAVSKASTWAR